MELYKIIADIGEFNKFLDWLPDLQENEKFYCCLFARKKYAPELIHSNDKTQLKRFLATKENLYQKILQLEIPVGRYFLKSHTAPQESLVLYINPNPRDMVKATRMLGKKCWDLVLNSNFNIHQEAMSCIQQSYSRKIYLDFDIDEEDVDFSVLRDIFPEPLYRNYEVYNIVKTRGGYHLLINTTTATMLIKHHNGRGGHKYDTNWYKKIVTSFNIDTHGDKGDRLLPVPGTFQGGHKVKFVNL